MRQSKHTRRSSRFAKYLLKELLLLLNRYQRRTLGSHMESNLSIFYDTSSDYMVQCDFASKLSMKAQLKDIVEFLKNTKEVKINGLTFKLIIKTFCSDSKQSLTRKKMELMGQQCSVLFNGLKTKWERNLKYDVLLTDPVIKEKSLKRKETARLYLQKKKKTLTQTNK